MGNIESAGLQSVLWLNLKMRHAQFGRDPQIIQSHSACLRSFPNLYLVEISQADALETKSSLRESAIQALA